MIWVLLVLNIQGPVTVVTTAPNFATEADCLRIVFSMKAQSDAGLRKKLRFMCIPPAAPGVSR